MKKGLAFAAALPTAGVLTVAAHTAYEKAQPPSLKVTVECPQPGDPVPDGAMVGVDAYHVDGGKAQVTVTAGAHRTSVEAGIWDDVRGYTFLQDVGVPAGPAHVEVRPESGQTLVRDVAVPICPHRGSR